MIHGNKNNSSLKAKDFYINLIVCQRRGSAQRPLVFGRSPN